MIAGLRKTEADVISTTGGGEYTPRENVLGEYTLGINFSSRIELLEGFAEQYGLKNLELLNASTWAAVYLETWGAEEVYLGRKASTYADEHVDE